MKTLGYAKSRARLRSDPVDKRKDPKCERVPSSGEPHANSSGGGFFCMGGGINRQSPGAVGGWLLTYRLCRLIWIVPLALVGCALIPDHIRPELPVPHKYPGRKDRAEAEAAEMGWRDFVRDRHLRCLIALALEGNRDLQAAALKVEQSRAQLRIARASWMPRVLVGGSMDRSHALGETVEHWKAEVATTAYEWDLFGRVRSMNAQAVAQIFASVEARRSVQIALVADVALQYFAWLQARAQVGVARQTLQSARGLYELTRMTFDAGATNELDVRTAEGQVQTVHASLLDYELRERETLNALTLLLGKPPPEALPATPSLDAPGLLAPVPPGLPSELVLRRADILQAEHLLRAARANVGAARAAFFPSVRLTGAFGTVSPELANLFGAGNTVWRFAPEVTLPIFTGGQNLATLRAAQTGVRLEVARYEKTVQTAFREVADALAGMDAARRQIEIQRDAVAIQQRRLELASARYRAGEDAYITVLLAQQALYGARQARWYAEYRWLANQVLLYRALGGGWK